MSEFPEPPPLPGMSDHPDFNNLRSLGTTWYDPSSEPPPPPQAWHPSDGSALALLRPWHRVFSPADWEAMLLKSIVPKLAFALQVVNGGRAV